MDIEKHLIIVKGQDKTKDISGCKCYDGKWDITYARGKTYSYNSNNVQYFKDPIVLNGKTTVVYKNDQPLSGIEKIIDFKEYIRIVFVTGYKEVLPRNKVKIEESTLNHPDQYSIFEYLKQLAKQVSVKDDDDQSFLTKQYEKITFISPRSTLAQYLHPTSLNNSQNVQKLIFPFGFNLSQKTATELALTKQLSVIEGPPGTGKTQTILNIIANAVMLGKTVAVVSNNNAATANVLEKLQKYGVDFIAAYLGNTKNKEKFFANQSEAYPEMSKWRIDTNKQRVIEKTLDASSKKLTKMLEAQNKSAALKQELTSLTLEKEYFDTYYRETVGETIAYRSLFLHKSNTIMKILVDYQQRAEKGKQATLPFKIKNFLRYGITSFSYYSNTNETIIANLQLLFYEHKIHELNEQIRALTALLNNYQFDQAISDYAENSMKLFKAKLVNRYGADKKRKVFSPDVLWKDFGSFINEYPVILSTTHSLRNCASSNYLFDYVIMDEASQVDIVTGALALSCAKNAVIVGDLKQLPNVVSTEAKQETNLIFNRFKLDNSYSYADNSMLSSIIKLFENLPRTLLKEHYRCHPQIISFCNQKFYNNELIILTKANEGDKPMVVYKTAKGNHARGNYNQRQIDVIFEEVFSQQGIDNSEQTIGIISPYRLQKEKLIEAMGETNIEVDTVHKYQGRERDVIILTTVVNEVNEFVDNPNLLNVAISRAVNKLIIVVADYNKNENSNISDLIRYVEYNNFEIINSSIYSVFDLLYHSYSEHLFERMKNRKRVSEYESENLMNHVIGNVLNQPEFSNLDWILHQPLKMLIRNPEKLDEKECRFVMNDLSHTDFMIFNKLDKMPVLVVEVDGYATHNSPKQIERDTMKDAILEKYEIPILRIKTNESGEQEKLYNKLTQILNVI